MKNKDTYRIRKKMKNGKKLNTQKNHCQNKKKQQTKYK